MQTFLRQFFVLFTFGTMQSRFRETKRDFRENLREGRSLLPGISLANAAALVRKTAIASQVMSSGLASYIKGFVKPCLEEARVAEIANRLNGLKANRMKDWEIIAHNLKKAG